MNSIVSIIVPVYNAEKYLEKCLCSLVKQTYKDLEIILIDDGSTDNSMNFLKKYGDSDKRIKIFTQTNKGAAIARNYGLSIANGEYVIFLDSDDCFEKDLIEISLKKAKKYNSDIAIFRAESFDNVTGVSAPLNDKIGKYLKYCKKIFSYKDIPDDIFDSFLIAPWNKLYKKSFLDEYKIEFQNIKRTNDLLFTSKSLICARRIILVNKILLHYRTGLVNSLQSGNTKTPLEFYKALYALKDYLEKNNLYNEVKKSYQKLVVDVTFYNINSIKSNEKYKELVDYFQTEGFRNLGFIDYKYEKSLSFMGYLQYRCVMSKNCLDNINLLRFLYKIFKISQYGKVVGIKGLLDKIKLNFIVKKRK